MDEKNQVEYAKAEYPAKRCEYRSERGNDFAAALLNLCRDHGYSLFVHRYTKELCFHDFVLKDDCYLSAIREQDFPKSLRLELHSLECRGDRLNEEAAQYREILRSRASQDDLKQVQEWLGSD